MMPFMTTTNYLSMEFYTKRDRERIEEKIKHYHDLYFNLKKRKDLRRCAKSRLMKDAEKNWQLWNGLLKWEQDFYNGNLK